MTLKNIANKCRQNILQGEDPKSAELVLCEGKCSTYRLANPHSSRVRLTQLPPRTWAMGVNECDYLPPFQQKIQNQNLSLILLYSSLQLLALTQQSLIIYYHFIIAIIFIFNYFNIMHYASDSSYCLKAHSIVPLYGVDKSESLT